MKPQWNSKATSVNPKTIDQEPQNRPSLLADHLVHNMCAAALDAHVAALDKDKIPQHILVPLTESLLKYKPTLYLMKRILMNHGVYKNFAMRRDFIKLQHKLKDLIRDDNEALACRREDNRHYVLPCRSLQRERRKSRLKALEEVRKEMKGILHSPRWRFPDNDKAALFTEEIK